MNATQNVQRVYNALLDTGARRATKFLSPKLVVRMTRTRHGRRKFDDRHIEVRLTIGRPNNPERKFIKSCLRAGEKFPVRKIRLGFPRAIKK